MKLVADVALYAADRVVLVRYEDKTKYDGEAGWFLPDDYLRHGEHPRDAASRIIEEQLGILAPSLKLAEIESFDGASWHLIFHFRGSLDEARKISPGPNIAAARWFELAGLPSADEVAHGGWALEVIAKMQAAEAPHQ
jgi:ADP-ribose pyrophosphatase YjhB (NUDIX family)